MPKINPRQEEIRRNLKVLVKAPEFKGLVQLLKLDDEQAVNAIRTRSDYETEEAREVLRANARLRQNIRAAVAPSQGDPFDE
jgi:hypothetical protein